jgi:hypothetical protein
MLTRMTRTGCGKPRVYTLSPFIAGVIGLAGNGGIAPSYPYAPTHTHALYHVTAGSNGFCGGTYLCTAKRGYDGPAGLGTPTKGEHAGGIARAAGPS